MTGDPPSYRSQIRDRIARALEILARMSFGDFDVAVPQLDPDDDFFDLFAGLDLVLGDLRATRRELDEQTADARLRAELWQAALGDFRSVEALVRALLAHLGPRFDVSRASYFELVPGQDLALPRCQWCAPGVPPSDRPIARPRLQGGLAGDGCVELRSDAAPGEQNRPQLEWMRERGMKAALFVPCLARGEPFGFLAFASRRPDPRWTEAERRLLRDVAVIVSTRVALLTAEEALSQANRDLEAQVRARTAELEEDIRRREAAEAALQAEKRERELELLRAEKLESLGTLAGGIAHDFNNSLTAITASLSLAAAHIRHDPELGDLLGSAMDAAFRATALTRQLLTFAKGGAPVKQCLRIGGLVTRLAEFCVRGTNVRCRVSLTPELRAVEVDPGQLEQVLGNLIINAQQAMPAGGEVVVEVTNRIAADPESAVATPRRYLCISIRDHGTGIAPEHLPRIFDPYFSTKETGSGLGLATAYSVVRRHDGFMRCESEVGKGSVFTVFLPASERQPAESRPRLRAVRPGRGRILVMDDDSQVRDLTVRLLSCAGYEPVGVASGADAMRAYVHAREEGRPFVAAIMDLTVPGGDGGLETIRKLRAVDPAVRSIVVSGYSDDPVLADCRQYGFRAGLAKPFRTDELLDVVATVTAPDGD